MSELNFRELMQPVSRHSVFEREDALVWCGSIVKGKDNKYYLIYSFWPKQQYDWGWVTEGEIGLAVSDSPTGPFKDLGTIFSGAGGNAWDAQAVHNPCCLEIDGRYYLYYMGSRYDKEREGWFEAWKNKQIGVAVADDLRGPWKRFDEPILKSEAYTWTETLVSNPTVCQGPDGKLVMVFKGAGPCEDDFRDCLFTCGAAVADHPLGPFRKIGGPQFLVPKQLWSVEDPSIWYDIHDKRFYCILKEFHGYFNGTNEVSNTLFESADGLIWRPGAHPLAFPLEIQWEDGTIEQVKALERPTVFVEDGHPAAIAVACTFLDGSRKNVQIALK